MTTPHDQAIREAAEKCASILSPLNRHIDSFVPIIRDLVAKVGGEELQRRCAQLAQAADNAKDHAKALEAQLTAAQDEARRLREERDAEKRLRTEAADSIRAAVNYANGRDTEWGERAETCFRYLREYLNPDLKKLNEHNSDS